MSLLLLGDQSPPIKHTSNLNSAGLAVFSRNSNHTNSLSVMLHMLSGWGIWHLSTGWSVATNTGVFTWASRRRFCHLCRFHAWTDVIISRKRLTGKRPEDSHVSLCRISHSSDWLMVKLRCHRRQVKWASVVRWCDEIGLWVCSVKAASDCVPSAPST